MNSIEIDAKNPLKHMKIQPLAWPEERRSPSVVARLLSGIPVLGVDSIIRRKLRGQLELRTQDSLELWGKDPEFSAFERAVSALVREYFLWPNDYFIPEDPAEILFWDVTSELRAPEAQTVLVERYNLRPDFFDDLPSRKYGDLVQRMFEQWKGQNPDDQSCA